MAAVVITPAQVKHLEASLYDLQASETEMEVLREAGVDVSDLEALRKDLRANLLAYLNYAKAQKMKRS